jgi:hypothetical protein
MIADRLIDWLRTRVGYAPTRWSLARIAAFAVVGLLVTSLIVPNRISDILDGKYNGLATKSVRSVALPLADTRGFEPTKRPKQFRVAWIGGSETLGVGVGHRAFIPGRTARNIGKVDGKRISTDVFYLDAIRLSDELSALGTALASKPDMVVVSLNPVWVMNDVAVQQWNYLDGNLALHASSSPAAWPIIASLVSPGDVGWKVLSRLSSAVDDRYDWGVRLNEKTDGISFLHPVKHPKPVKQTELGALALRRPVDFFLEHAMAGRSEPDDPLASQLLVLEREVESSSAFNKSVLRAMFDLIDRAGVDAYFYVPPINPEIYATPAAKEYIAELRKMLAEATAGRTNAHLVFDTQGLQDRIPATTEFEDLVHTLDPRPEASILSDDLCGLLRTWGRDPQCEGR